jgi:hypothetical protein
MNEEKQRQTAGVLFFKVTVALPELPSPLFAVAIAHTFRFDYHESGGCALYEVPDYDSVANTLRRHMALSFAGSCS